MVDRPGGPPRPAASVHHVLSTWLPLILLELAVFYLSSRPYLQLPPAIPYLDKVAHFSEYLLVGALLFRALRLSGGGRVRSLVLAAILAAALGCADENFQRLIPGRVCSIWDWTADVLGAGTGLLLGRFLERRLPPAVWALNRSWTAHN
jgi:VanZ family protein